MKQLNAIVMSVGLMLSLVAQASFALPASHADVVKVSAKKKKAAANKAAPAAKPQKAKPVVDRLSSRSVVPAVVRRADAAPAPASLGQLTGLHKTNDPLSLKSAVAHVEDLDTKEVLFSKNSSAVLPIASITKLMTALVITEAGQDMNEMLTITEEDVDTEKHSTSRLRVGYTLSRRDALHLALMSSENRAANALGRHYNGGVQTFVNAMNSKASALGMSDSRFVEPTGLSSSNVSSAPDLSRLLKAAYDKPLIRELSTSPDHVVAFKGKPMQFRNTNALVKSNDWDIGVSKTGFISEAGRCLVMNVKIEGRRLAIVLLDSMGKASRLGDANRIKRWLESNHASVASPVKIETPLPSRGARA